MLLKYLHIHKNEEEIRNITFKKGVNLIVDTTTVDNLKDSGNNVGKTTVLKLVDYCLGAKAKSIYQDSEFKTDSKIKDFLETNNVVITLCLSESIETDDDDDIIIKRNFLARAKKLAEINGDNITDEKEYQKKLKLLLFNFRGDKPSFREIASRYIRSDASSMDKVVKYLFQTATNNTYESVYRFLLTRSSTVDLSSEKNIYDKRIKFNKLVIKDRFKNRNYEEIEQHLELVNNEIYKLNEQKKTFNVNPNYEREFSELQEIKDKISSLSSKLSKRQYRLHLLNQSLEELHNQKTDIDADALKFIYEEAQLYIKEMQNSFDNVLKFHNALILNKQGYLSEEIPNLKQEISKLQEILAQLLTEERRYSENIMHTGSLSEYENIVSKENKKYEQKGRLEEEAEKLKMLEDEISNSTDSISEIVGTLKEEADKFKSCITTFNAFFSDYSEKFYGEQFALSATFDEEDEVYKFSITNVEGSIGDGKKKGIIAAFDLAYISYALSKSFKTPQFAMHDRIEGIHGNQLRSLFDCVNDDSFNGQYVVSVLSGKISELQLSENYLEENKVLELSQSDKLFKVND